MMSSKLKSQKGIHVDIWFVTTVFCMLFFILGLVYPILKIFRLSVINGEGEFTLAYFAKFFGKPYYLKALFNSLKVSVCATLCAVVLGTIIAYIMRTMKIAGKGVLDIIIIITMLSPPFIGAYSWILLLGRSGSITTLIKNLTGITLPSIYGFPGMLLVFTMQLYPLIYLYVSGALKNMDNSLLEAAENFGCTGIKRVFRVVLPLIAPMMLSGGLLVFMRSMADFGTPQLIGEGYRTMPYLIYNEFISEMGGDDGFAATLSVLMVILTTVLFLIQKWISKKMSFSMSATNPVQPKKYHGWKNVLAHIFVYLVVLIGLMPQLTVTYTSFKKTSGRIFVDGFSLDSYRVAFSKMGGCIRNTFVFSILAVAIIVIIGTLIAYITIRRPNLATNLLDILTMMPYIIPGSVMGIALLLGFNKRPLMLVGTVTIIILAYVLRRMPYTIRSSAAILSGIHPSIEEAAISLGASNLKTFMKVTAPMMAPGVLSGAILSWMTIISELSASVLLYVNKTQTMTIAIYTEVVRANYGTAAALSVMLTLTTVIVLLVFFKISGSREISL